jgi:hypothetical protein
MYNNDDHGALTTTHQHNNLPQDLVWCHHHTRIYLSD